MGHGKALLFGKDINEYAEKELWENLSYVPQVKKSVFSYGVLEMVVMGLDKENSFSISLRRKIMIKLMKL